MTNTERSLIEKPVFRYHLQNRRPVELSDFTSSLEALHAQYMEYAKTHAEKGTQLGARLYVRSVENGSIIVELAEFLTVSGEALAASASLVMGFASDLFSVLGYLKGDVAEKPEGVSKQTMQNCQKIVAPLIKDNHGQIEMQVGDRTNNNNYIFVLGSNEAGQVRASADSVIAELTETQPDKQIRMKVLLRLTQIKDGGPNKTDRGIIEEIEDKTKKLFFEDEAVKDAIIKIPENFLTGYFLVDAIPMIQLRKIVAYNIIRVHEFFVDE